MDVEAKVKRYLSLRDTKKEAEDSLKEILAPLVEEMGVLEGELLSELDSSNQTRLPTTAGTAYPDIKVSTPVKDWGATLKFIIENEAWDLLPRKVNSKVLEENYEYKVPGVGLSKVRKIKVRRS